MKTTVGPYFLSCGPSFPSSSLLSLLQYVIFISAIILIRSIYSVFFSVFMSNKSLVRTFRTSSSKAFWGLYQSLLVSLLTIFWFQNYILVLYWICTTSFPCFFDISRISFGSTCLFLLDCVIFLRIICLVSVSFELSSWKDIFLNFWRLLWSIASSLISLCYLYPFFTFMPPNFPHLLLFLFEAAEKPNFVF